MTTDSHISTKAAPLTLLCGLRDEQRKRRQARVAYQDLERELAPYRAPSEIADLLAAVDQHGDSLQAEQIRGILSRNLTDYRRRQRLAS